MAVEVKPGAIITATNIKSGTGKNGTWAFGKVNAENGKSYITVWFDNPEVYKDMHDYKVGTIVSVKKTARKYTDKSGAEKWIDEYTCNAVMEMLDDPVPGFARLDDSEIPF